MKYSGKHFVAVVGGAVAGAEAAYNLAEQGYRVVVFDQMMLPYGKIEDGLPKWHHKLREKEIAKIDKKILHENIRFVPGVKIGKDISFEALTKEWGFSAILFATGAWKDRPLGITGIDNYINKGLVYQNPLLYWFNHYHEAGYNGTMYDIPDGATVIGGGLASIDVVKLFMIDTVQKALVKRGIGESLFELEKRGVAEILDKHGLTLEKLGLKGATLVYRRREKDMPLTPRARITEKEIADSQRIALKIMTKYKKKFLFNFEELSVLEGFEVDNDNISALIFQKMKIEDGKLVNDGDKKLHHKTTFITSAIGSIPELIPGLPTKGILYDIEDKNTCRVAGHKNIFAVGNAVTGKGNIVTSLKHSKGITKSIIEGHLLDNPDDRPEGEFGSYVHKLNNVLRNVEKGVDRQISSIVDEIECRNPQSDDVIGLINSKTKHLQSKVGFDGDYYAWKEKFKVARLAE